MRPLFRRLALFGLAVSLSSGLMTPAVLAMTIEDRAELDLSAYAVTNPSAGFFDVAARRAKLATTTDHLLLREIADIKAMTPCATADQIPVMDGSKPIPAFYEDRDGWKAAITPYQDFEDTVSKLAAQDVVAPESGAGLCMLKLLKRWADGNALKKVDPKVSGLQTWFQIESTLFAAALSYSVVRDDITGHTADMRKVEAWMAAVARRHLASKGAKDGTCCNNHFYRRALYAATIGVLISDDELFRTGISAIYSALSDADVSGALPLEMKRQQFAAKYQVFATMYLAMIAQIAARQGYDLYSLEVNGRKLGDVVNFSIAALLKPESAADAAKTPKQDASFIDDTQYYSWLELLSNRPQWRDSVQALLASERPVFNRSLGGFLTLYFLPTGAD
jgi:poly(beta-D-mannuronate) lyase